MPVIIRELVIRATVNDESVNTVGNETSAEMEVSTREGEALLKEYVERVAALKFSIIKCKSHIVDMQEKLEKRKKNNF
jgi:hypothetical protein